MFGEGDVATCMFKKRFPIGMLPWKTLLRFVSSKMISVHHIKKRKQKK